MLSTSLPSAVRQLIRANKYNEATAGVCLGYLQANLAIIPERYADAFETFCTQNPAPCPLLYRSKPGEVAAPPLAAHSDIRTDVGKYWHYRDGQFFEELTDLTTFDWKEMVTFYIGCSFGFEDAVKKLRELENLKSANEYKQCAMYLTNIQCNPSPPFCTNMVVSLRPIHKDLIEKFVEATYKLESCHGAPVLIGNPSAIGIKDVQNVDFGEAMTFNENDIPVFWACGVTCTMAVKSASLPQFFSHSPGHMFICDTETTTTQKQDNADGSSPKVVKLSSTHDVYSVLSSTVKTQVQKLEQLLLHDPGNRGVGKLVVEGDLLKSAMRLFQASSVAITTGFPVFPQHAAAQETDGIPGAISIAKALCALGKKVHFVVDKNFEDLMNKTIKHCVELGILHEVLPVLVYERVQECSRQEVAKRFLYEGEGNNGEPWFDHLVSIERTGPAKDGVYRSMRSVALEESLVSPVEDLFVEAAADGRISTTGIGDGGNELGMGKVMGNVEQFVKNGEVIACNVASDYLIAAGVSNWGGNALAVALYLLSTCPIHMRYIRKGLKDVGGKVRSREDFLNTVKQEEEILKLLVAEGVHDGVSGKCEASVDGFQFYPHHADQIQQLQGVI